MIELKPCPFCGNKPKLFGVERRDYVAPENEIDSLKDLTDDGWARKTAKEFWVQPFCKITCILGNTYSRAFGIVGGIHYTSQEAAIKAWNRRCTDEQ